MADDIQTRAPSARNGTGVASLIEPEELAALLVAPQEADGADAAADASFPELLRSHRLRIGLTQRALAVLSTISPRTIRDLESGRANARTQTIHLLADALRLQGLTRELFLHAALGARRSAPGGPDLGVAVRKPVNALLGRDTEVRTMVEALESGRRRMIALFGLPGVGKSRVAAEIAARLSARRGWPVLWLGAEPAAAAASGAVFGGLLQTLRLLIDSGRPDVAEIHRIVGNHEALLVLDGVADVRIPLGVEELLAYCPGVRVISTSRAPWQVTGVQGTVISPLVTPGPEWDAAPSLGMLADVPSVQLLVDRLSEVQPGFALSAGDAEPAVRVCRRLDGLPLAIEAVAGRFGVLSLRQLAEVPPDGLLALTVLGGRGEAAETIGSLIASSFYDLEPLHRGILREVARLDGGWTVSDAATLLHRPLTEIVDDIGLLIAHGLVRASHAEQTTGLHVPNLLRALLVR